MSQPHRGLLITLDGPKGAGKSTTARNVGRDLERRGLAVHVTTQPSRNQLGEIARSKTDTYRGLTLACLVAADRYHHLAHELRPRRDAGEIVICDRYVASSFVLQQMDGVPLDFVEAINAHADLPDLAVILTADPTIAAARIARRGSHDRFHTDVSTSAREVELYSKAAKRLAELGHEVVTLDTTGAMPDQIARRIGDHIAALVDVPGPRLGSA
ncbi:dTMP kinase [Lentzea flava]|uniref:Thymidylate kinase n=1 Tax=Lentzea flava TaxID=103732 RepID=A0ABQ2VFX0_9PSEU|nr:thymidylate kinase (EC 2.7.4.9) [Lentzea flava]GGU84965.1 dTMP kinase [Lentzea flava]